MKKLIFFIAFILFTSLCIFSVQAQNSIGSDLIVSIEATHEYYGIGTILLTPRGTEVIAIEISENDWTDTEISNQKEAAESSYSGVTVIRDASKKYNCHFYAWAEEYPRSFYWLNASEINNYIDDGSYIELSSSTSLIEGDIILYVDDNQIKHSAVFKEYNGGTYIVTSKWDDGPVCEHPRESCRYATSTVSYKYYRLHTHTCTYLFVYVSETQHQLQCTCGNTASGMLSHNFTYTYTDTTHTASCSQNCGYVGTAEGHTFVVEEYSDNNHVLVCSTCGYTVVEAHDLDYTNESTHHSIECTVCDYTSAAVHAILYAKVNVNYHNKYCGNCTYSVAEAHTWTQSGALYSCGYCGQVSSFIPVVPASLSAGVLSQLMAVPAAEGEITVAFVDGVQYAMLDGQIYLVVECE